MASDPRRRTGFTRIDGLRDSVPLEVEDDGEQRDGEQDQLRAQHVPSLTGDQHDGRRHEHAPEQDHRLGGAVDERARSDDVAQVDGDADEHEPEQRGRRTDLRRARSSPTPPIRYATAASSGGEANPRRRAGCP